MTNLKFWYNKICYYNIITSFFNFAIAIHYGDVMMTRMASWITSLTIVYSIVYSGVDQRKLQSSASLAFVRWIHRRPVNSPHKWPVTRKMFPFDDVIMHTIFYEYCKCQLCTRPSAATMLTWLDLLHKIILRNTYFLIQPMDKTFPREIGGSSSPQFLCHRWVRIWFYNNDTLCIELKPS